MSAAASQPAEASYLPQWLQAEGSASSDLLRLALLREIFRELHASKSRLLATGRREEARSCDRMEKRVDELRQSGSFPGDLGALLSSNEPLKKKSRPLPQALTRVIEPEKLNRYDRAWESTIAAEAFARGWNFWRLEAWVEINGIESWNQRLSERLWPEGIVLWVESGKFEPPRWQGQWLIVMDPGRESPSELLPGLEGSWSMILETR